MMPSRAQPEPDFDYASLRASLVAAARRVGDPQRNEEAEDLAHAALVKFFGETPRADAPPKEVRAHRFLHDVSVDWERRRATRLRREIRPSEGEEALPLQVVDDRAEQRIVEAALRLAEALPEEEFVFVLLRYRGFTDDEIATRIPGWDVKRVTRVRRRLSRNKTALLAMIRND